MKMPTQEQVDYRKKRYIGKRIRAIAMPLDPHPVPAGTEGTCYDIDGIGQLLMEWDNGSTLSLIPDIDSFEVI